MKVIDPGDNRFVNIFGAKIISIYRKVPLYTNEWMLELSYKESIEDLFGSNYTVRLISSTFINDILNANYPKPFYFKYAFGGTDVDFYSDAKGKGLVILNSPNDSLYVRLHFDMEQFNELVSLVKAHYNESKPTGMLSIFNRKFKITEEV